MREALIADFETVRDLLPSHRPGHEPTAAAAEFIQLVDTPTSIDV